MGTDYTEIVGHKAKYLQTFDNLDDPRSFVHTYLFKIENIIPQEHKTQKTCQQHFTKRNLSTLDESYLKRGTAQRRGKCFNIIITFCAVDTLLAKFLSSISGLFKYSDMSVVVITEQPRPSSKASDKVELVNLEETPDSNHNYEKDLDPLRHIDYLHIQQQMELDLKG